MIELLHGKFALAAARCMLAGVLIVGLYAFAQLNRTQPATIAGDAVVIDGDTIDIAGMRVRLQGIDAPERAQLCPDRQEAATWQAGNEAKDLLTKLIDNKQVSCDRHGTDKYRRLLGVCHAGGVELNAEMVRRGMAWAYRSYSDRYIAEEDQAKHRNAGVWRTGCQSPWEYRKMHQRYAER